MPRLAASCAVLLMAGCFADAPALDPDPETSSEGTNGGETGTDGAGTSSAADAEADATTTSETSEDGSSEDGSSEDGSSEDAPTDEGSTGEPARFCDDVPEAIDMCRDFDGGSPLAGWYDPVENMGEVSISDEDPFSPPNALVTAVGMSATNDTADAMLASSTQGYTIPVEAFEARVRLWIDADCFEIIETRSAIQFAWVDPDLPDDAPFVFNFTVWFAENRVMLAETDSPLGYGGASHITNIDIPAEQWIDVGVVFSMLESHAEVVIDGEVLEWPLEHATDDVVVGTSDLPMSFGIGQSASHQPPCVMRYDDFTLDLQ